MKNKSKFVVCDLKYSWLNKPQSLVKTSLGSIHEVLGSYLGYQEADVEKRFSGSSGFISAAGFIVGLLAKQVLIVK